MSRKATQQTAAVRTASAKAPWWRGAVIYQIYLRSFFDSNNDGSGDLAGVRKKLDYVQSLGVDAVWLSPFYRSPMADFGYDVSDYFEVDPLFGSMTDFEAVLERAHTLGLKVIVDQIYSHTSDQHAWFRESRSGRNNSKSDWYVWADAKSDGTPPNNWLSLFGGPAWTWDTSRRQYYMHNFLAEQPDLNFHNPDVRSAVMDVARFWLDKGVDGLRLDVANFYYSDARLRNNPPADNPRATRPYQYQRHLYDRSRPENLRFAEDLRTLADSYGDKMLVAEIGSQSYVERSIEYTQSNRRLHTAYNFLLLENGPLGPELFRDAFAPWNNATAWPSWSFSNHDVERVVSRWGDGSAPELFAKMLLCLLLCLRGTIFLYQGEELGLPQAKVPRDALRDPEGIRFWPHNLGRDGARTPFPWKKAVPHAGFSEVEPWLPVDNRHAERAVDRQIKSPASVLHFAQQAIAARNSSGALRLGRIAFEDQPLPLLKFRREWKNERVHCAFNLGPDEMRFNPPEGRKPWLDGGLSAGRKSSVFGLAPFGFGVWRQTL